MPTNLTQQSFIFFLISLSVSMLLLFSRPTTIRAQFYCAGALECAQMGTECSCDGGDDDGNSCSTGCFGGSCECQEVEIERLVYGCFGSGSSCSAFCRGYDVVGNGCYTYTPPVVQPPVVQPPPPVAPPPVSVGTPTPTPTTTAGPTPTPTPTSPPPPPPPSGYSCNGCSCVPSYTGTDFASCSANCGPCEPPIDPLAGLSACDDIVDTGSAVYAVIRAGNTIQWQTWRKPSGATAWDRLRGTSGEDKVDMYYTAPDNAYLFHAMIAEPETEIRAFYLLNPDADAWYFYQGKGKPAVVFTSNQTIIDQLLGDGYSLLPESTGTYAAMAVEKRVFRTPNDHNTSWSDDLKAKIPRHGAAGYAGFNIPYESCAESIGADDHNYFRISNDSCNPRGSHPKTYNGGGALPAGTYGTGAYLGMSKDFRVTRNTGPNWHIAYENLVQIWPGNTDPEGYFGVYRGVNPASNYWDDLFYTLMANDKSVYLKSITMLVPESALRWDPDPSDDTEVENRLYWRASTDFEPFQPSHDQNSDSVCSAREDASLITDAYDPAFDDIAGVCSNITIRLDDGDPNTIDRVIDTSTESLVPGQTYSVSTRAKADFNFNDFFNQYFSEVDYGHYIHGWYALGGINSYEIVDCRPNCPSSNNSSDNRSLKYSTNDSNIANSAMVTDWIHADHNLDNTTITVEFDMKVESGTATLENTHISRYAQQDLSDPELPEGDIDAKALEFSISDTETTEDIELTDQWQHFIGSATFDEDPNSSTTMYRIVWRGLPDGRKVFLDNVVTTSSPEIDVNFFTRPANTCSDANEIEEDTLANGPTFLGYLGDPTQTGLPNYTLDTTSLDGDYDLFARIYDWNRGGCYGHPLYTQSPPNACGMDTNLLDIDKTKNCSSTCSKVVTFEACTYQQPAVPQITVFGGNCPSPGTPPYYSVRVRDTSGRANSFALRVERRDGNHSVDLAELPATEDGTQTYADFLVDATPDLGNAVTLIAEAINNCGDYESSNTNTLDHNLACTVSGRVYQVSTQSCNDTSQGAGTQVLQNARAEINWNNSGSGAGSNDTNTFNSNGSFTIGQVPYRPDITQNWDTDNGGFLHLDSNGDYACACNPVGGDPYVCSAGNLTDARDVVSSFGTETNNFFVIQADLSHDPWWQSFGGLIFGENQIDSDLPLNGGTINNTCQAFPFCNANVYLNADPDTSNSLDNEAGIPISNGRIFTANNRWVDRNNQQGAEDNAGAIASQGKQDYEYFADLLEIDQYTGIEQNNVSFRNGSTPSPVATLPGLLPDDTSDDTLLYIISPATGNTVNINFGSSGAAWNLGTTRHIIMVDVPSSGNVMINGANDNPNRDWINIAEGGYLMVVSNGDITFNRHLGYDYTSDQLTQLVDAREGVVEGIFIASDELIIESFGNNDRKFVAEGTFVGWNNVRLNRSFYDTGNGLSLIKNAVSPTDQFFFRPDLVANTPEEIRSPDLKWSEAN